MKLEKCTAFFAILLLTLTAPAEVFADKAETVTAKIAEIDKFLDVEKKLSALQSKYEMDEILIILDIDNTILTSSIDLGGDVWYQWQTGKLAIKPTNEQKVKCLFKDTIGLLYELNPMKLTEHDLAERIADWQRSGISLFALTSRAPNARSATERELYNKGIDLEKTALAPSGQEVPIYRETTERELSYMKGIMMTSGMNKGDMIEYILNKTQRRFKAIVFVDDSRKNIDAVYKKYKNNRSIDMNIFHYVRVEELRKKNYGSVITHEQVEKMDSDWKKLNQLLENIFPARVKTDACLTL